MKRNPVTHIMRICGTCCLAVVVGLSPVCSVSGGESPSRIKDVVLKDGLLHGNVSGADAGQLSGVPVRILHGSSLVAVAQTDDQGQFAVQGLRNGVHTIQCAGTVQAVRFWSSQSAPPSAVSKLTVVTSSQSIVRGQAGGIAAWAVPAGVFGGALAITLATTLGSDDVPTPPPVSP